MLKSTKVAVHKLVDNWKQNPTDHELEVRFGSIHNHFQSNVSASLFQSCFRHLDELAHKTDGGILKTCRFTIRDINYEHKSNDSLRFRHRTIQSDDTKGHRVETIQKRTTEKLDCIGVNLSCDVRIATKHENGVGTKEWSELTGNHHIVKTGTRTQERHSFFAADGCRIDFSQIFEQDDEKGQPERKSLEIEIECTNRLLSTPQIVHSMMHWIHTLACQHDKNAGPYDHQESMLFSEIKETKPTNVAATHQGDIPVETSTFLLVPFPYRKSSF